MKDVKIDRAAVLDALWDQQPVEQAVVLYATLFGLFTEDGSVAVEDIKEALDIEDEHWPAIFEELHAVSQMWVTDEGRVTTGLVHEVARISPGPPGRPSQASWQSLRRKIFSERFELTGRRCPACGQDAEQMALDHIVPISRGGSNHPLNLMPLCTSCNSQKGAKTWREWRASR